MTNRILESFKKALWFFAAIFIAAPMIFYPPAVSAQTTTLKRDFNHNQTGFPLTGAHSKVECETCHTGGLFKGTATACEGCHTPGRRVSAPVKSVNHISTDKACINCHINTVSFLGARFNHIGVLPKQCATCHNSKNAVGKPSGHIQTDRSCDSCHRTSAWIPTGFNHEPPLGQCDTCHKPNGMGRAKPGNHITTTINCDNCHISGFTTFLGALIDHQAIGATACNTCHITGQGGAKTKTPNHIPSGTINCNICHKLGYTSFAGGKVDHTQVQSISCKTCHSGAFIPQGAPGTTPTHIKLTSTQDCKDCHNTSNFGNPTGFVHPTNVSGTCNSCHLSGPGKVKYQGHIFTTAQCDSCHNNSLATSFTSFAGLSFNHQTSPVDGKCGSCHLQLKTVAHIPTTAAGDTACDLCHMKPTTSPATPGLFLSSKPALATIHTNSTSILCSKCHSGGYISEGITGALAKTKTHISTQLECNSCHNTQTFIGAKFNHLASNVAAKCGTCHVQNGGASALPIGVHIPLPAGLVACDSCHTGSTYQSWTAPIPTMVHSVVQSLPCTSCHNGNFNSQGKRLGGALGAPLKHIPIGSAACTGCHKNSDPSFSHPPEKMNHTAPGIITITTCNSCHETLARANFGYVLPTSMSVVTVGNHKGSTTTQDCVNCHGKSFGGW